MRQFARPMRIESLSLEARVLYTAFALFLLIGFASSGLLMRDIGLSNASVSAYYLGTTAQAAPPSPGGGGPALELPGDMPSSTVELRAAKSDRQMLETFHFHLFSVPVLLLIIGHLFMLTGLSTRTKVAWLIAGSASTLVHLFAPLLVRYGGAGFAPVMSGSAMLAAVTWTVLTAWPIWEMWRPRSKTAVQPNV